jgi:hypothetical protein
MTSIASSLDCRFGANPPLVADGRAVTLAGEDFLQGVERLDRHPQRLLERRRAERDDHELLEIDAVVGMLASVEHVHHRYRQGHRRHAAEVLEERQARRGGRRLGHGDRDAEDRVCPEVLLVERAILLDHRVVDVTLVSRVLASQQGSQDVVDVPHRVQHPLAAVAWAFGVA